MPSPPALGTLLRLLSARLDEDVQALYAARGIAFRPRFFPIADRLRRDGPTGVGELAKAAAVSQPAATQTLNEMVRLGLVALEAGEDRRARLARLTPEGERLVRRLSPLWDAIAEAAAELEPGLAGTLARALKALEHKPFRDRIERAMR